MNKLWQFLCFLYDFFVPRFITEDVAIDRTEPGDGWTNFEIVCAMSDIEEGEHFDGVATADSFVWLFFGFTYKLSNFRPWPQ